MTVEPMPVAAPSAISGREPLLKLDAVHSYYGRSTPCRA